MKKIIYRCKYTQMLSDRLKREGKQNAMARITRGISNGEKDFYVDGYHIHKRHIK